MPVARALLSPFTYIIPSSGVELNTYYDLTPTTNPEISTPLTYALTYKMISKTSPHNICILSKKPRTPCRQISEIYFVLVPNRMYDVILYCSMRRTYLMWVIMCPLLHYLCITNKSPWPTCRKWFRKLNT